MRPMIMISIGALVATLSTSAMADSYYARTRLDGLTGSSSGVAAPKPVATCGSLVKGSWFVDYESETGLTAQTLEQANAVCATLAAKGAGTCGWTDKAFYGDNQYKIKWGTYVGIRPYNDVNDPNSQWVYAAACPAK
jgi:hypothetical protein